MGPVRRPLVSLTFVLFAACDNGEGHRPRQATPTPAGAGATLSDTTPIPADAPRLETLTLPEDFPSDFPLPPGSIVVEASSTQGMPGVLSSVKLAVQADTEEQYDWYRRALSDAGWQIDAEDRRNGVMTLHATHGGSYVDLAVKDHPEADMEGWVLIEASVWKLEPL